MVRQGKYGNGIEVQEKQGFSPRITCDLCYFLNSSLNAGIAG